MKPEHELQSLWATAKKDHNLTLDGAVALLKQKGWGKWGTNTVKAVVDGKSKELREIVLRKVLEEFLGLTESVRHGPAESANSGVEGMGEQSDDLSPERWKLKAESAERRLKLLQDSLRAALKYSEEIAPPVSSTPVSAARAEVVRAAEAKVSYRKP